MAYFNCSLLTIIVAITALNFCVGYIHVSRSILPMRLERLCLATIDSPPPPSNEKSRLLLLLSGQSVHSAIFRAELKKELTFFRGCSGIFNTQVSGDQQIGEIVAEGKTKQLARFVDWCKAMASPLSTRKPNFQGPPIVIAIDEMSWKDFKGDISGFLATDEPPELNVGAKVDGEMEAMSMTGTDESV